MPAGSPNSPRLPDRTRPRGLTRHDSIPSIPAEDNLNHAKLAREDARGPAEEVEFGAQS